MQYTPLLFAVLACLAAAQNGFTMTTLSTITAGTPYNITWAPTTGASDTITLILRQGSSTALSTVETIASSIPNSGSYLWTPSPTLPAGSDYAFEIVSDSNKDLFNYSGQFSLDSTGSSSAASSSPSTGVSSLSSSPISSQSSASASGSTTLTVSSSSGSSTTGTNTGSAKSTGSSSGASAASTETGKTTATGETGGKTTTAPSKTTGQSQSGTASASSTSATGNSAVALKAGGVLLGFVAVVMAAL